MESQQTSRNGGDALLDIRDLEVDYLTAKGRLRAVDGVDLEIRRGEILGLAGESGAGKTALAYAILRLLPRLQKGPEGSLISRALRFLMLGESEDGSGTLKKGEIAGGRILFDGENLLELTEEEMREIRGNRISMVFQDPIPALDPLQVSGLQTGEALEVHGDSRSSAIKELVFEYLDLVRLSDAARIYQSHPDFLSGGEGQRVMIASSLVCDPELVIADEPTSNLDVTIQRNIMDLLLQMKKQFNLTLLLITHDLGVIAEAADRVAIMYAGKIVETGSVRDVFTRPRHPYTKGLLESTPRPGLKARLAGISGEHPDPFEMPSGCRFHPRCLYMISECKDEVPPLAEVEPGRRSACIRVDEIADELDLA
jgi:peptide/nickel transport system ATP-binding protein